MDASARQLLTPASPRLAAACWRAALLAGLATAVGPAMAGQANAGTGTLDRVVAQIDAGDFGKATQAIDAQLALRTLSPAARRDWEFQHERMRRMRLDFSLDRTQAIARVRKQIPDLREDEFDRWDAAGDIEHLDIDGQRFYFNRAVSNLFLLNPQAAARRAPPVRPAVVGQFDVLNPYHAAVVEAARADGGTSLEPRRVRVTQSLTVKPDAVPAGETIRAWIPYPRAISGQQQDIRLLGSVPAPARIAPETTLQRTAYLQARARPGQATQFSISYELTVFGRYFAIDPDAVTATPALPELQPYLREQAPHIAFTPAMRAYSRQVVGGETNPYRIAQKLFAAVDAIPWAGAREYSTLSNIGDYALHAGHADCGQQTLLLMTLLRMNGIPARWQSGWVYSDGGYDTMHDWGQLYLAPYGWVPMDVTTGQLGSDDPALRWFYLGGLDAYRIAFNDEISQPFVPAKRYARSETVDSQRGEAEWRGGNLYFDQWDYDFQWEILPMGGSKR